MVACSSAYMCVVLANGWTGNVLAIIKCNFGLCRLDADAGLLTNFEVLDLLRRRGATSDPLGSLGAVSSSECKVPINYIWSI